MSASIRPAALCSVWLMVGPATAGQVIDVHLNDKVPAGRQPCLVVSVHQDLAALVLDLERDDGKKVHTRLVHISRDSQRTFHLPQQSGRHRYRGTLMVRFRGGDGGTMSLDFAAEVVSSLGLAVRREELDLEGRSLILHAKRPIARVDYQILSEDGSILARGQAAATKADTTTRVSWRQKQGKVMKIKLVAHDIDGIYEDIQLIPWTYSIPHEEVKFETGKWYIRSSEAPKLDHSYRLLQEGIRKYGKLLEVKLYVAGYTDTVAAADYNQRLSEQRALAIAHYFGDKGFRHPIYYQGFGERGLKVPTPDETDEPSNRRAEYILAAEPPNMDIPGATLSWKRLRQALE